MNWGESNLDLLKKANSVSLVQIASKYGLDLKHNPKISCPFPNHKSGRERTASFVFYNETNSFYCFGCKAGSRPVDFVLNIEEISREEAINKILIQNDEFIDLIDYDDNLELHIDFSNFIRPFIQEGLDLDFYLKAYDEIINQNTLSKQQLEKLIFKIKDKIINGD